MDDWPSARVDRVVSQLHRVQSEVLLLVGERDTAHLSANRGAFWLLPESAQLEVLPNAGHLLDEPDILDHVAEEAERWFARTLQSKRRDTRQGMRRISNSVRHSRCRVSPYIDSGVS